MSFRRRLTLVASAAVAAAVLLASVLAYALVRNALRGEIDTSLRNRAAPFVRLAAGGPAPGPPLDGGRVTRFRRPPNVGEFGAAPGLWRRELRRRLGAGPSPEGAPPGVSGLLRPVPVRPGEGRGFAQLVTKEGVRVLLPDSAATLPVDAALRRLAQRGGGSRLFDLHAAGQHLRALGVGLPGGRALELARSLGETDSVLANLRLVLLLVTVGGVALAALLGRLVAGTAIAPVRRLTDAAEHVARTQDLGRRIEATGSDELGRLAESFNSMLIALDHSMRALDESARAQRQLVADASHELRTPVTSLRTNIEILQAAPALDDAERRRLIGDVVAQLEELSSLIADLIELARGEERPELPEDLQLDELVAVAIERAARHAPAARIEPALEPTRVRGVPARLQRALNNLLDNATKFGGPHGPIEVTLRDGELRVRDHGPGVAPEDRAHVFDRFYRGAQARALPGSGLGLAIVAQVVAQHGGSVTLEPAAGGGTLVRLRLPTV